MYIRKASISRALWNCIVPYSSIESYGLTFHTCATCRKSVIPKVQIMIVLISDAYLASINSNKLRREGLRWYKSILSSSPCLVGKHKTRKSKICSEVMLSSFEKTCQSRGSTPGWLAQYMSLFVESGGISFMVFSEPNCYALSSSKPQLRMVDVLHGDEWLILYASKRWAILD